MIVSCPSCTTRYRHPSEVAEPPPTARCSQCDEQFPLVAARRNYVLLRSPGTLFRDDPVLPAGLQETTPQAAAVADVAAVEDQTVSATAVPRRGRVAGPFGALLLAGGGATAAYFGSSPMQADPLVWAGAGGAVGLLLGWAWIRWMARKR